MKLSPLQQYGVITANYWAFTLTDGALRMLVVFHFHQLGYTTLEIAALFLFYEFFGVVTNLYGGWIGARYGLRLTLWVGTLLQILSLLMLVPVAASWPKLLSVVYVMAAQAISGIAKDLNKMSAKSAIKTVVPETPDDQQQGQQQLFKWVAILTGSKNALKGVGFFLGGVLLTAFGFNAAVGWMAAGLALAFLLTLVLPGEIGKMKSKPAFASLLSKSQGINVLSLARFFSVWCTGCLVRGGSAGVSRGLPRLEFLGDRWLSRSLGDRLRHRPGISAWPQAALGADQFTWGGSCSVLERSADGHSSLDCCGALAPGGCGRRYHRRPCRLRGGVRDEFVDPLLHGAGLHGCGERQPQCRLLLHGQRRRTAGGHLAVGGGVHARQH